MEAERLVGVDIGTQGTKAALFDRSGACLAEAFEPSELVRPAPGAVEEDPERQLASVQRTIRKCVESSGTPAGGVAAIAIDGQMAGIIGIGRDGRAVTPYDSWLDTRCAPYIERMEKEAGEEVMRRTGGPPSFNHGPKILWWQRERPEVFRAIRSFVQPGGYAAMRLCGLKASDAFIDPSYLHFSGFADNPKRAWDPGLCRQFGLEAALLPRVLPSETRLGGLTAEAGQACGLASGTPVLAGCGDTAASFLSCGATREGICVDVAGTASVLAFTTAAMKPDFAHRTLACGQSAVPGLWHPYAYINGGGLNMEWFRADITGAASFEELERLAEALPAREDDPLFVPHLGGRVNPSQPALRGAWLGLAWSHGRGHLYRAVLEGVALEYGVYLGILQGLYPGFRSTEVRVTGGGGRSHLWNRVKADVLGLPVAPVARAEGAPLGAALLAGFGAGLFPSLDQAARAWVKPGEAVRPAAGARELAGSRMRRYVAALEALNRWAAQRADK
jgi:xylulokinase